MKTNIVLGVFVVIVAVAIGGSWYQYKQEDNRVKTEQTKKILADWAEEVINGNITKALDNYPNDAWGNRIWFGEGWAISCGPDGEVGTADDVKVPYPKKRN